MNLTIRIMMNGKPGDLPSGTTLTDFCRIRNLDQTHVVAELNGIIIKKEAYGNCVLKDGDTLEIVRFVGGG